MGYEAVGELLYMEKGRKGEKDFERIRKAERIENACRTTNTRK